MNAKNSTLDNLDNLIYQTLNAKTPRDMRRRNRAIRAQNNIISYRKTAGKLPK